MLTGDIKQDWDNLAIDAFLLQAGDGLVDSVLHGVYASEHHLRPNHDGFHDRFRRTRQLLEPDVSSWRVLCVKVSGCWSEGDAFT